MCAYVAPFCYTVAVLVPEVIPLPIDLYAVDQLAVTGAQTDNVLAGVAFLQDILERQADAQGVAAVSIGGGYCQVVDAVSACVAGGLEVHRGIGVELAGVVDEELAGIGAGEAVALAVGLVQVLAGVECHLALAVFCQVAGGSGDGNIAGVGEVGGERQVAGYRVLHLDIDQQGDLLAVVGVTRHIVGLTGDGDIVEEGVTDGNRCCGDACRIEVENVVGATIDAQQIGDGVAGSHSLNHIERQAQGLDGGGGRHIHGKGSHGKGSDPF